MYISNDRIIFQYCHDDYIILYMYLYYSIIVLCLYCIGVISCMLLVTCCRECVDLVIWQQSVHLHDQPHPALPDRLTERTQVCCINYIIIVNYNSIPAHIQYNIMTCILRCDTTL